MVTKKGVTVKRKNIESMSDSHFRRVIGVKKTTFERMVWILKEEQKRKKKKGGRNNKLTVKEMLLAALEYIREYRTYAAIAASYGISESNAYQAIKWVENTLVAHPDFRLPGRKALLKSENAFEVVLVDVTESPIERPKKSKEDSTLAKRSGTQ